MLNQDYRSAAFHRVAGRALMVTHCNPSCSRTDDACLGNVTLRDRFTRPRWTCGGSGDFTSALACITNACVIAQATPQSGDTAAQRHRPPGSSSGRRADGAQDANRDRAYLSTNYRDNVDCPPARRLLQGGFQLPAHRRGRRQRLLRRDHPERGLGVLRPLDPGDVAAFVFVVAALLASAEARRAGAVTLVVAGDVVVHRRVAERRNRHAADGGYAWVLAPLQSELARRWSRSPTWRRRW